MKEKTSKRETVEVEKAVAKKRWEPPQMAWMETSAIRTAMGQSVAPGEMPGGGPQCDSGPGGGAGAAEFDPGDPNCA